MCIWAQRDDRGGGWLLRKDDLSSCTTYRSSPRPYTRSISILGKSTLGIENGDERASEGGGWVETAGSRWTEGWVTATVRVREETSSETNERRRRRRRTGGVFTKGHVARSFFFFFLILHRDFSNSIVLNFLPRIFGDFVRGRKQKGRRSVKSNSANVRGDSPSENILVLRCGRISRTCDILPYTMRFSGEQSRRTLSFTLLHIIQNSSHLFLYSSLPPYSYLSETQLSMYQTCFYKIIAK